MVDAQHAVGFAFMLGILVGVGAATLTVQFLTDAMHPRNNKQYTPPMGKGDEDDDLSD